MTVGKPQPVEYKLKEAGHRNYNFEEGTRYWAFDELVFLFNLLSLTKISRVYMENYYIKNIQNIFKN